MNKLGDDMSRDYQVTYYTLIVIKGFFSYFNNTIIVDFKKL